jgi:hypothetical protein
MWSGSFLWLWNRAERFKYWHHLLRLHHLLSFPHKLTHKMWNISRNVCWRSWLVLIETSLIVRSTSVLHILVLECWLVGPNLSKCCKLNRWRPYLSGLAFSEPQRDRKLIFMCTIKSNAAFYYSCNMPHNIL